MLGYDGFWKWTDFGFAKKVKSGEVTVQGDKCCGTTAYLSPELHPSPLVSASLEKIFEYSYYSDYWAYGIMIMFLAGYNPVRHNYYDAVNKMASSLYRSESVDGRIANRETVYKDFLAYLVSEETRTPYLHMEPALSIRSCLVGIWGVQYQSHFLGDVDNKASLTEIQHYYSQLEVELKSASSEKSKLYNQETAVLGMACMRLKERARLEPALLKEYQEKWFKEHPLEAVATASVASEQDVSKEVL